MGTNNFKPRSMTGLSFGLTGNQNEEDSSDLLNAYNEAKLIAEEIERDNDFLFHRVQVDAGYYEGFEVYVVEEMDAQAVYDGILYGGTNQHPDEEVVHFIDKNGYPVVEGQVDMMEIAYVEETRLPNGDPTHLLVRNREAIESMIAREHEVVMHHVAVMAKELGLHPMDGSSERDAASDNAMIDSLILQDLLPKGESPSTFPRP